MREWTFGPYQIKSLIGRGGMGEVYRAYDTVHDRVVALKLLAAHLSSDDNYRARFRRECHLAARLREPHVIPIHSFGEHEGRLFLDMRLVEGRDLATILDEDGKLAPAKAVNIIGQVARALDAAHHDGLIHRDVKPSNVILDEGEDGDEDFLFAYLVDFGVARSVGDDAGSAALTSTGGAVGTFDYMPPERFAGGQADKHSDVYSLSCMLYESLTGRRPFGAGQELAALMFAHMNSAAPKASEHAEVNSLMDEVIARGMAKDPAQRYATATALASAARSALLGPRARDRPATAQVPLVPTTLPGPPPPSGPPTPLPPNLAPPPPVGAPVRSATPPPVGRDPSGPYPPSQYQASQYQGGPAGPTPPPPPANGPGPRYGQREFGGQGEFGGQREFGGQGGFGPGGTQPKRAPLSPRNRNIAAAAVAAAAVLAVVLIVVLQKGGGSGNTAATTPPSGSSTGTGLPSSQPVSTGTGTLDPTLVSLLPSSIPQSDCKNYDPSSVGSATRAIVCTGSTNTADGPTTTRLFRYLDIATLRSDLNSILKTNSVGQASAACPAVGYRNWHTKGDPSKVRGQMASYFDASDQYATITWDDEQNLLLAIAQSPDRARLPGLCTWWSQP